VLLLAGVLLMIAGLIVQVASLPRTSSKGA
jgi:hypothetical protein